MGVVHRPHPELAKTYLALRSLLHQARALFSKPVVEYRLERFQRRIEALARKVPERISGRHVFFKESLSEIRNRMAQDDVDEVALARQVMVEHAARYRALPPSRQRHDDKLAEALATTQRHAIEEDQVHEEHMKAR